MTAGGGRPTRPRLQPGPGPGLTSTEKRIGMRPKSCPGLAAYSMAWHEWLQPGPRRIASTRLICFSSVGTAGVDILAALPAWLTAGLPAGLPAHQPARLPTAAAAP